MCTAIGSLVSGAGGAASAAKPAIGPSLAAYGQYKQGQFEKDMANYQASLSRDRAGYAQKQGELEAAQAELRHKQIVGAGLTAFAGNGVLLESRPGSAASLWEVDQAKSAAYDKELIRTNAELAAWGFATNADMIEAQGRWDSWAGKMGAAGTIVGAAGGALKSGMTAGMGGGSGAAAGGGSKYTSGGTASGGWGSGSSVNANVA